MKDYTLDRFYRVQDEVGLPDGKTIHLRSLSDGEMGIRRKAAMLAARACREELRDENGAAFRDFIAPIADADEEDLIQTIVSLSQSDFAREAVESHPRRHIPYPDDADLEERLAVDEKRDAHWKSVREARTAHVEGRSKAYEERVRNDWSREQRVAKAGELQKTNQAMAAYLKEDELQLILLGCFKDKKRKQLYFKSAAVIEKLDARVKIRLRDELNALNQVDIFTIQGFSLTESPM